MLYLYAIADAGVEAPDVPGLEGAPVIAVEAGSVAGVCRALDEPPDATEAAVLEHARVVESAAARGPVLPARFGTAFADADAVREALAQREGDLRAALERVRGRVEIGVRVLVEGERRPPAADGRSYLLGRLEQQRRAAAVADEVHGALARGAAADTMRVTTGPPLVVHGAYLVAADEVDGFRARAEALAAERPDVQLLCTGPWPPYSFASLDDPDA